MIIKKTIYVYRKSTTTNGNYDNYPPSASRGGPGDMQTGRGMNSARR